MATGPLRQRKVIGIGEIYESFITALPLLSAVQFLSILTLLYNDLYPHLVQYWSGISLLKFLLVLSGLMALAMVLVYRFLIPSIWTFRGKQLYGFESELMEKVDALKNEVEEMKNGKVVATTKEDK